MQNPGKPRWSQVSRTGIVSAVAQNRKGRADRAPADAPRAPSRSFELLTALVVFFLLVGGSRRGSVVGKPVLDLGLDLRQVLRLRLQVAGVRPLELGFQRAADAPVSVAEMVVDSRVLGLEIDRALEVFHRILVIADAVISP